MGAIIRHLNKLIDARVKCKPQVYYKTYMYLLRLKQRHKERGKTETITAASQNDNAAKCFGWNFKCT